MTTMRRLTLAALVAALLCLSATPALARGRHVAQGFVGMNLDVPRIAANGNLGRELDVMIHDGVEQVRLPLYWASAQPYHTPRDVPRSKRRRFATTVGGVPTDFSHMDSIITQTAAHRMPVLLTVLGAPNWAADRAHTRITTPRHPSDYAAFMYALVKRYGPNGSFWSKHPRLPRVPIRSWQIWNEPNLSFYWHQPFAHSYIKLLAAARFALRTVDPGAQVVMGGFTYKSWEGLQAFYAAGGRGLFDVMAVHPYTRSPSDALRVVERVRRVMDENGDAAVPIRLTEVSWPSSQGKLRRPFFAGVTERGQAHRVHDAYSVFANHASQLGIIGVDWFTWVTPDNANSDPFRYAGVRRAWRHRIVDKPAARALRSVALGLEGCRVKRHVFGC